MFAAGTRRRNATVSPTAILLTLPPIIEYRQHGQNPRSNVPSRQRAV
jgi:hypothetical protein